MERVDLFPDMVLEIVVGQKGTVGAGGGGEAARNTDGALIKGTDHLAERSVLAADAGHVVIRQLFQWRSERISHAV